MFKVTAVRFHTAIQKFSRLINSVVYNGLLHTRHAAIRHACGIRINKLVNKPKEGPVFYHVKLMIQGLKKTTSITILSSQYV